MINARILLLEDQPDDAQAIIAALSGTPTCNCTIKHIHQLATVQDQLAESPYDLALLSLSLQADKDGTATVQVVQRYSSTIPIVVLANPDSSVRLTEALQAGARCYFIKGQTDPVLLPHILKNGITQHREHQALQASETRFRNIISHNADGIILVDDQGIVRYTNPAAEALFGLSSDEFYGRFFGAPVVDGEKTEIDIPRQDSAPVIAEMRVERTEWEGQPVLLASLRDITLRKTMETSLTRTTTRLTSILESISDGFFTLDHDMHVTYFNTAAERLLGRSRHDVLGHHLFDKAFPEAKGSEFDHQYTYALRHTQNATFETYFGIEPYADWYDVRIYPFAEGIAVYFQVITERKQAERRLRESEERYRSLVDLAPEAILVHIQQRITYINSAGLALFGATEPEDMLDKSIMDFIHPASRNMVYTRVMGIVEQQRAEPFAEQKLSRLDGSVFDAEVAGSPIMYMGEPAVQIIIRDISSRKQMEEALRQHRDHLEELVEDRAAQIVEMNEQLKIEIAERQRSEQALRFTQFSVDNSSEAAFWMKADGQLVYVNTAACKALDYTRDELLTMRIQDIDMHFTDKTWATHWEDIRHYGSFMLESQHRTKDGRLIPVEVNVNYLEYDDEAYNCAFARDITLRKQAEEAYHTLIDHSVQGFSISQNGRIVFANEAYAHMSGYTVDELLAMSPQAIANMVHPDDYERVVAGYRKRETGERGPERYEYRMIRKNGEVWWLEIFAVPITYQGMPAVQASFIDITERKQAEEVLKTAHHRLRQLDRMKSEFIANVSHELRTPVTNLKLYHHLMERQPAKTADYIEKLGYAIRRLEAIVEEILFVSDFDQAPRRPTLSDVDLNELVIQTGANWNPVATQKGLILSVDVAADLVLVQSDITLMVRVLDVLVDNAIKYTPAGGTVELHTQTAAFDDQEWGGVIVRDSGEGLSEADQQRVFDRFFRGQAARRTTTPGAGLGLAIAQELVIRQHGRIEVSSTEGVGTTFTVWLPAVVKNE